MINIAICDDEGAEITYLTGLVRKWAAARSAAARVSGYESAENFLFACGDNVSFDIILLDIQMKEMDGVELARQIRAGNDKHKNANDSVQIVFVTGYPDYIADGYDVSALHYLMKPVDENKLFEVLDRASERLKSVGQVLLVHTQEATVKVPFDDILYIEAFAHNIVIHTKTASIETRTKISEIEKSAGNGFVRCHRSYIVGLNHICSITKTEVILDGGKNIPLSRRLYKDINLAFIAYHKGRKI